MSNVLHAARARTSLRMLEQIEAGERRTARVSAATTVLLTDHDVAREILRRPPVRRVDPVSLSLAYHARRRSPLCGDTAADGWRCRRWKDHRGGHWYVRPSEFERKEARYAA